VTVRPGAAVTGQDVTAFVGERISERAAVPKTVTIIDAIPVTDVGKPYKVPLRAAAAEEALTEALAEQPGVLTIRGQVEAGAPTVVLTLDEAADRQAVERVVKSFAVNYQILQQ
jgi:fatty-acyl-CoA synthase